MKNLKIRFVLLVLALAVQGSHIHAQSVEIIQKQIPVLTLTKGNPVMLIKVNTGSNIAGIRAINIDLTGTSDLNDLEHVRVFSYREGLKDSIQYGKTLLPSQHLRFKGKLSLSAGTGYFRVFVSLRMMQIFCIVW
ncbi:MAG: BNR-repeat neuraminidase N-terminal domain-containing protein [Bacteroidales bacterium]|nr:BNR-repeat neuraminidase N-terminal domain-containing protein [Bacteroidales bacterium]